MTKNSTGRFAAPPEVLVPAVIAAGGALLFLLVDILLWRNDGGTGSVWFSVALAVLGLAIAAGLVVGFRPVRVTAIIVFLLLALLHLIVTLNAGPLWVRVVSGILAAVYVYGVVLLNTAPALSHLNRGGSR